MQVVDFTNLPRRNKLYAGANGSKISVIYEGQQYMLKFPPLPSKNKEMSYSNSCFSEYLGCQIYESIGIPVQKTMLGTYTVKGKTKIVVACGDFTEPGITLQDFASLKNQIIDSERNGYGTELSDILHTFEEQEAIDREVITERFWDMFIVDALIGNWDRHNGRRGRLPPSVGGIFARQVDRSPTHQPFPRIPHGRLSTWLRAGRFWLHARRTRASGLFRGIVFR